MAIGPRLRFEVFRRDGFRCWYCRTTAEALTIDHVVPRSAGGSDDPTNLVTACATCNVGKGATQLGAPTLPPPLMPATAQEIAACEQADEFWNRMMQPARNDG